jgi:hypothetical protein
MAVGSSQEIHLDDRHTYTLKGHLRAFEDQQRLLMEALDHGESVSGIAGELSRLSRLVLFDALRERAADAVVLAEAADAMRQAISSLTEAWERWGDDQIDAFRADIGERLQLLIGNSLTADGSRRS